MQSQRKTCTKCGEAKPLDGFYKNKGHKYGVDSWCKPCRAEQKRRYREANREELAEYHRRYREENREELAEYHRRHYRENREELAECHRRHYRENREIVAANTVKRQREGHELSKMFDTVPPRAPYLPGEDAFILADSGMTIYQKAIELGRTYHSVRGRRQRLLADRESQ